ncbi:MAG: hypothetical protein EHM42_09745, partial [Planctomycetaceae bacterium]
MFECDSQKSAPFWSAGNSVAFPASADQERVRAPEAVTRRTRVLHQWFSEKNMVVVPIWLQSHSRGRPRAGWLLATAALAATVVGCASRETVRIDSLPASATARRSPLPLPNARQSTTRIAATENQRRTSGTASSTGGEAGGNVILASQSEPASAGALGSSSARPSRIRRGDFVERLQLPPDLPGAESGPVSLPTLDDPEARARAIEDLFPPLPRIPEMDPAAAPPGAVRYTLRELEERTLALAPGIDQAQCAIAAADGLAWQVGRAPNPLVGYEADTVRTIGTPGYHGVFFEQMIRTGGKLSLAREVASFDIANAELDYEKARANQLNGVRKAWFNVLVAKENVRITRVLAVFSESMFQLPVDQLREEQIAPYEPLPLRALVVQARAAFEAGVARERAAWQQLGAAI